MAEKKDRNKFIFDEPKKNKRIRQSYRKQFPA